MDYTKKRFKYLEERVRARNRANQKANEIYDLLCPIFKPLAGQKILKKEGGLLASVARLIPDECFYRSRELSVARFGIQRGICGYTLAWCAKAYEQVTDECFCVYEESVARIADIKGQLCGDLVLPPNFRTDYTVDEIMRLRADFEEKKRAFEDARDALYPFAKLKLGSISDE